MTKVIETNELSGFSQIQVSSIILWLFFLALGFLSFPSHAQQSITELEIHLEPLGVSDGLSSGLVHGITQDTLGYLWLATSEGLNRYDGYRIKTYEDNLQDSLSLPDDNINHVYVDSRGWLWVNIVKYGLYILDFSNDNFVQVKTSTSYEVDSPIREDPWGNIWIKTVGNKKYVILQLPDQVKTPTDLANNPFVESKPSELFSGLPIEKETDLFQFTSNRSLWLQRTDSVVQYILDLAGGRAEKQAVFSGIPQAFPRNFKGGNFLVESPDEAELYYIKNDILYAIDARSSQISSLLTLPKVGPLPLIPEFFDSKSQLWCRYGSGIYYQIDLKTGSLARVTTEGSFHMDLQFGTYLPFLDNQGNIWFPSSGYGVYKHSIVHAAFNYHGDKHEGPSVGSFIDLKTDKGVGVYQNGSRDEAYLSRLNIEKRKIDTVAHLPKMGAGASIVKDDRGNLWISDKNFDEESLVETRLWRVNTNTKSTYQFPAVNYEQNAFFGDDLFWLKDQTLMSVISGTYNEIEPQLQPHLVTVDLWKPYTTQQFERYRFEGLKKEDAFGYCMVAHERENGEIWLGFKGGGLLILNPKTGKWKHFKQNKTALNSLPDNNVLAIQEDPLGNEDFMWLGTKEGLVKMNVKEETFTKLSVEDGLPDEVIYGILTDEKQRFWISTNHGLSRFDLKENEIFTFTKEDGIQHTEFNEKSYYKTSAGIMVFGGVGGITWFHPKDLDRKNKAVNVVINNIRVNNILVAYTPEQSHDESKPLLTGPLEYMQELKLNKDQRFVTFEFSSLDLTRPSNNRYRCRLLGSQDEWLDLNHTPEVTYSNLEPGEYTFEVQGTNYQGDWGPMDSIEVTVIPIWWETRGFQISIILIVIIVISSFIRVRDQNRKNVMLLRNRISKDLHDEIGSTLSSISLFGTVAESALTKDLEKASNLLKLINTNASQTMESMNDIVWAVDSEKDSLHHLVNRVRAYAYELETTEMWSFDIECAPVLNEIPLSMIQKRNAFLIAKEAINNILKHSNGSRIDVKITSNNRRLRIGIKDNGNGFDTAPSEHENIALGGNGITNMKNRAKELGGTLEISSHSDTGTCVWLTFKP